MLTAYCIIKLVPRQCIVFLAHIVVFSRIAPHELSKSVREENRKYTRFYSSYGGIKCLVMVGVTSDSLFEKIGSEGR